jgi:hypothetical protein
VQDWLIYLPAIASAAALIGAYAFLKTSARHLQKHRESLRAAQTAMPEPQKVHDALKPVESALEKAVRDIIVGVEESHRAAREEAEARPYA